MEYAVYSSYIFEIFFSLSKEELEEIERTLPPYSYILETIGKNRNIPHEEIEILKKNLPTNPFKARKILKKKKEILDRYELISEEYHSILRNYRKEEWKDFMAPLAIFYGLSSFGIYSYTSNPLSVLLYLLTYPLPYQLLKYLSFRSENLKKYTEKSLPIFFILRAPLGFLLSLIEFGIISPLISKTIEKYWTSKNFPNFLRKTVYELGIFLSRLKVKKFDERELREILYDIKVDSTSIPRTVIERFRERVDSGAIELEDPREKLYHPYALSWYRRRVVAVPKGEEIEIVDRRYIKKLARIEGLTEERLEGRIKKYPLEYLGYDLWNGKPAFVRDVIGVLPCKISDALAYKEGYLNILAMKCDELIEGKLLMEELMMDKLRRYSQTPFHSINF